PEVDDLDDVLVGDDRRRPGLAEEPPNVERIAGELGLEHLDRDLAMQALTRSRVDRAHPTFAELLVHGIAASDHAPAELEQPWNEDVHARCEPIRVARRITLARGGRTRRSGVFSRGRPVSGFAQPRWRVRDRPAAGGNPPSPASAVPSSHTPTAGRTRPTGRAGSRGSDRLRGAPPRRTRSPPGSRPTPRAGPARRRVEPREGRRAWPRRRRGRGPATSHGRGPA